MQKPGRNDPCPCGSGKKYKACCLNASTPAPSLAAIHQALRNVLGLQRMHRWQEAITLCRDILKQAPNNADALNLLGISALHDGDIEQAVNALGKAVRLAPNNPDIHGNLGFAFHEQGALQQAEAHYRKAIALDPRYVNAHYNLHALLIEHGDLDGACASLRTVLTLSPQDNEATYMLGILESRRGDAQAAEALLAQLENGSTLDRARLDAWRYLQDRAPALPIAGSMRTTFEKALAAAPEAGLVLEFGVRHGNTLRQIAALAKQPAHGFDSFEGLPEAWHDEAKGSYSTRGVLPQMPANVTLHPGWFDATLPTFLAQHDGPARLINIDCDIYSSTKTVLELLASRIVPGTVLVFDEYIGNAQWREDEYKAFQEAVAAHGWQYDYLCFSPFTKQVAARIR
jgi:tetratricopeptide (TPR) repeat protein